MGPTVDGQLYARGDVRVSPQLAEEGVDRTLARMKEEFLRASDRGTARVRLDQLWLQSIMLDEQVVAGGGAGSEERAGPAAGPSEVPDADIEQEGAAEPADDSLTRTVDRRGEPTEVDSGIGNASPDHSAQKVSRDELRQTVSFDRGAVPRLEPVLKLKTYFLEGLQQDGQWARLEKLSPSGLTIGRTQGELTFPDMRAMAERHAFFGTEDRLPVVRDLGTKSGVFLRIRNSVRLGPGDRFRVGSHLLEFQPCAPLDPAELPAGEEVLCTRPLDPHGFLIFLRSDGSSLGTFPLLKPSTVIGRDPAQADVLLAGDQASSRCHARIRFENGLHWLEDAGSQNGSYIQIQEQARIEPEQVVLVGMALFRVTERTADPFH